jgi:hypothetical protein
VHVIEIAQASKTAALNVGDSHATRFPRLYVDADTEMQTSAARNLSRALENGAPVACPDFRPDLSASTLPVRMYYRVWQHLWSVRGDVMGVGAYGLSEAGRARFAEFPQVVADDRFVRKLFKFDEFAVLRGTESRIKPPRTTRDLVTVKTRVFAGNLQHDRDFGDGLDEAPRQRFLSVIAREPQLGPAALIYAYVQVRAKLAARWRVMRGRGAVWSRDRSARA